MSLSLALLLPAVIVLAGLLERVRPLRKAPATWPGRLPSNLALLLLGVVTDRVLQPAIALLSAWLAAGLGAGLIGRLALPGPVAVLIGVLACDLGTYLIHRLMHTPALWRLHALHHSDRELDWSTSFRHHPFEKIASSRGNSAATSSLRATDGSTSKRTSSTSRASTAQYASPARASST